MLTLFRSGDRMLIPHLQKQTMFTKEADVVPSKLDWVVQERYASSVHDPRRKRLTSLPDIQRLSESCQIMDRTLSFCQGRARASSESMEITELAWRER